MNHINEIRAAISLDTFRPTASQRDILLDIDRIINQDRKATKGEVVENDNADEALKILINIGLVENDNDVLTLSNDGKTIVNSIKKEFPEEVPTFSPKTEGTFYLIKEIDKLLNESFNGWEYDGKIGEYHLWKKTVKVDKLQDRTIWNVSKSKDKAPLPETYGGYYNKSAFKKLKH